MSTDEPNQNSFEVEKLSQLPVAGSRTSGKAVACMVLGALSFMCVLLTAVPAVIFGALALIDIRRQQDRLQGRALVVCGMILAVAGSVLNITLALLLVLPALETAREAKRRFQSTANLKAIALGIRQYHDTHNFFPHPGSVELIGQPDNRYPGPGVGLSWRVRLLPYLGEQELFEQFHLDEPWDSRHNKKLISKMPGIYRSPYREQDDHKTVYQAVVGAGAKQRDVPYMQSSFSLDTHPLGMAHFIDGTSNTITIVEVASESAVIWTKPDDWRFDPDHPRRGLDTEAENGFLAAFADSSIDVIPDELNDETLRRLFCRNDRKPLKGYVPPSHRASRRKQQ